MELIKIAQDHYIIVYDSEIKVGDWCEDNGTVFNIKDKKHLLTVLNCGSPVKITHSTQPLNKSLFFTDRVWGCERLSLGEVKELIGEVDVEKRFWDILNSETSQSRDEMLLEATKHGFKYGYNQALEDNKEKVYTEEDLFNAIGVAIGLWSPTYASFEEGWKLKILQSLQPKTEWKVEFVDGKLALKK